MKTLRFLVLLGLSTVGFGVHFADASPPNAFNTVVNGGIQLGGSSGGVADARSELDITVRMVDNAPRANSTVEIHFGGCSGADLHLAATQPFPGMSFDCADRIVSTISDAQGVARFRILGGALAGPGNSPGLTAPCAEVFADGVRVNRGQPVRVAAYDLNGTNGVNAVDMSLFMSTLFAGPAGYRERADYNGDGVCDSADLAKLLHVLATGGSTASATSLCF